MTTKPPNGLAATGHPDGSDHDVEDLSDELVVDSSQDVTVEASDDSTLELQDDDAITGTETPAPTPAPLFASMDASMETPPPVASNQTAGYTRRAAPTLLGMPLPSMPLPGSSRPASTLGLGEDEHDVGEDDDEVTVMARPSVTDDEEEATKVEPAETAIRAAASRDDEDEDELTAALSTQASVERERALRKSMPPSLDAPLSAHSYRAGESSGAEFADSADLADDDDVALADQTPGVALDDDESATGTYSPELDDAASELEAVLAPRRPTSPAGSAPLGGAGFGASPFSASTPLARSEGFGGRLPTPSAGLGLTLPPSPSPPPPAASPFSSRLSAGGAPYPRSMSPAPTGSIPALQIPAPSGAVAVASTGGIFRNVQLPLGGLVASCLACLVGGLVIGGKFLGTRAPAPAPVVAAAHAPLPPAVAPSAPTPPPTTSAPVVVAQPRPAPAHAMPPAAVAAAPAPAAAQPSAPAPSAAAATPTSGEPSTVATGEDAPKPAVKRAARPTTVRKVATNTGDAPTAKPRPKVAKGWVDPFAD